ncbi:MAG: hypothetical protein Q3972_08625 [Corynebacterium sp.]|nr:hypothetical protein [Corynebacterium sp.]
MRRTTKAQIARACCALGSSLLLGSIHLPLAQAIPTPQDPTSSEVASDWVNSAIRPTDGVGPVTIDIEDLSMPDPSGSVAAPTDTVTATIRISNTSDSTITNLNARVLRADSIATTALARTALGMDDSEFAYGTNYRSLSISVEPRSDATVTVSFNPNDPNLAMTRPAVYPVMISISGNLGSTGSRTLDSERFLLPVKAESSTTTTTDQGSDESTGEESTTTDANASDATDVINEPTPSGAPITVVWPLTGRTNVLAGETGQAPGEQPLILSNDDLAKDLESGGRLDNLLEQYRNASSQSPALSAATCIAIDPDLLNTVSRMRGGYSLATERANPTEQPLRLKDSWTKKETTEALTPGSGSAAATQWLDKLQSLITEQNLCVVALPWADTELGAINRTGNRWLMREAIARGTEVIQQVLGVEPLRNVVLPESGYVSDQTASALTLADTAGQSVENIVEQEWQGTVSTASSAQQNTTGGDALNDAQLPEESTTEGSAATPVRVLLADNTVVGQASSGLYSRLYNGSVVGISFQGSLAATLATVGPDPQTTGYSNPSARFDYSIDSEAARAQDAAAALRLAVANYTTGLNTNSVIVMPPHYLDGSHGSQAIITTVADLLDSNAAHAVSLTDLVAAANPPEGPSTSGTQYADPAEISDTEILRAKQQANYTEDLTRILSNDPQIALSRFRYTEPLMDDLLRSLTGVQRRAMNTYADATHDADLILNGNRDMLRTLRAAISLLPPGNVYTRTAPSSPLLIVARNGLALPLNATLGYTAPSGDSLAVPTDALIPARGSITLSMTADIINAKDQTNIRLWLATEDGSQISSAVDITVQTRSSYAAVLTASLVSAGVLGLAVSRMIVRRRRDREVKKGNKPGRHRN